MDFYRADWLGNCTTRDTRRGDRDGCPGAGLLLLLQAVRLAGARDELDLPPLHLLLEHA